MSAVGAPPETELVVSDPAPEPAQTETPPKTVESAAAEPTEAADLQVEVSEPAKPDYITRDEWEKERAEIAARAAAEALESDRRRRQTENARKAKQEQQEREEQQEALDILKASLGARGVFELPDESAVTAIDRIAKKKAERMASGALSTVDEAWDFITAPAYGKTADLDDSFEPAARMLAPKVQHLIDVIRPTIEANARKDYIHKDELPKYVKAEVERQTAQKREGEEPLRRPEGQPSINTNTLDHWDSRVAHEGEEGYPVLTAQDWATYRQIRRQNGLS